MGKVSRYLRRGTTGYFHWCPACQEMHPLPDSWTFNGNVDKPTFSPSFKHEGLKLNKDANGKWVGEGRDAWLYDANGKPISEVCHYILTDGVLNFCGDCTHDMAGKSVPMAELPPVERARRAALVDHDLLNRLLLSFGAATERG